MNADIVISLLFVSGFIAAIVALVIGIRKEGREKKVKEAAAEEKLRVFLETENAKPKFLVKVTDIDDKVYRTSSFKAWGEVDYWYGVSTRLFTSKQCAQGWIDGKMRDGYAMVEGITIPTCNIKNMIPEEEKHEQTN